MSVRVETPHQVGRPPRPKQREASQKADEAANQEEDTQRRDSWRTAYWLELDSGMHGAFYVIHDYSIPFASLDNHFSTRAAARAPSSTAAPPPQATAILGPGAGPCFTDMSHQIPISDEECSYRG